MDGRQSPDRGGRPRPVIVWERQDWALLGGLIACAALVRAVAIRRTAVIFNDGPVFLDLAANLAQGRTAEALAHDHHPLYPWLVASISNWTGDFERAGVLVSLVFGTAAVGALFAFARAAWDRSIALMAAGILAVHPYAVRFAADVQSESVYLFLFVSSVGVAYRALGRGRARDAALCGVLVGLAYLTRPEGVGVGLVALALAFVAWIRGRWPTGPAVRWSAALVGGGGLIAVPYLVLVSSASGRLQLSRKKSLLAILGVGEADVEGPGWADFGGVEWLVAAATGLVILCAVIRVRGSSAARVRLGPAGLGAMIAGLAGLAAVLAWRDLGVFAATVVSTIRPEVILLIALAALFGARQGPTGRSLFILSLVGLYAVVLFGLLVEYDYLSRRHVLPPVVLLFGYAGSGAMLLVAWLARRLDESASLSRLPARSQAVATGLVLFSIAAIALPKAWHDHRQEEVAGRLAAEWLAERPGAEGVLASNRQKHGYYAALPWRPLWHEGAMRSLDLLDLEGVEWVIAEDNSLAADGTATIPVHDRVRLVLVERHRTQVAGRRAIVFELIDQTADSP